MMVKVSHDDKFKLPRLGELAEKSVSNNASPSLGESFRAAPVRKRCVESHDRRDRRPRMAPDFLAADSYE